MSDTASPPLLETNGLSVTFGGVKAVVDVSLALEAGKLYGLVGPNGSGKTTFLNAISRLVPTSSGTMAVNGVDYTKISDTKVASIGISRTFQTIRLLDLLNVEDNVKLGADVVGNRKRNLDWWTLQRAARKESASVSTLAAEAMERVGISHLAKRDPSKLSYGMQRRVEIARAIAMRPKLLLLDEPTAGMREDERVEISKLSQSLVADGMTVLLVEHNLRMMTSICEHLYVMYFGNCIADGNPREVMRTPAVQRAYIGHSADVTV
ncbi:MAG: ABC-type branched-chain amino acid transport system ATPase component [Pseudonocardiales bacterium]|nr:ABC-type branched-chain amino acid transport system ATPase component [Pseudonocardiales bacterium]